MLSKIYVPANDLYIKSLPDNIETILRQFFLWRVKLLGWDKIVV